MSTEVCACSKLQGTRLAGVLLVLVVGILSGFPLGVWCSSKLRQIETQHQQIGSSLRCTPVRQERSNLFIFGTTGPDIP